MKINIKSYTEVIPKAPKDNIKEPVFILSILNDIKILKRINEERKRVEIEREILQKEKYKLFLQEKEQECKKLEEYLTNNRKNYLKRMLEQDKDYLEKMKKRKERSVLRKYFPELIEEEQRERGRKASYKAYCKRKAKKEKEKSIGVGL